MKKLLSFFLLVSTLSQASSIIHKSMNYVDPESKVVVAHTISGMKNIEMEKLTSDYWSFLKTQEGDDDLFYLITDKTLKKGNRSFGLLADDVKQVQSLCGYKMHNDEETFAHAVLPPWLEKIYTNKQYELIEKIDFDDPEFQYLREKNIHRGVLSCVIQHYHQKTLGHNQYLYTKESGPLRLTKYASEKKVDLSAIIKTESPSYVLQDNIGADQDENLECTHIIVPDKDFNDPNNDRVKNNLKKYLSDNPEGRVVLAFDDTVNSIRDHYAISPDIKVKNLIVTGKSLKKIGDNFLCDCSDLKEIEFSDGLEEVGNGFLSGCRSLKRLRIRGLKKIGDFSFYDCICLKELELLDPLEDAGDFFANFCVSLEKLKIRGLKKARHTFLLGCRNLKELEFLDELEEVEKIFLAECKSLKKLKIRGLKNVEYDFLNGCICLKELELLYDLEETEDNFLSMCNNLEILKIRGLRKAGNGFLCACNNLKKVEFSDELEEVGDNFLSECHDLKELELSDQLKEVGDYFLEDCKSLEKLTITQALYDKLKKENKLLYIPKNTKIIFKDFDSKKI